MSKNISLQKDGVAKTYNNVSLINTGSPSGSRTDWVPEDETEVVEFTVTQNGTYDLADYGYYGAYRVNVLVPGGSGATIDGALPIGTGVPSADNPTVEAQYVAAPPGIGRIMGVDPITGKRVIVGVDEDGYLTETEYEE